MKHIYNKHKEGINYVVFGFFSGFSNVLVYYGILFFAPNNELSFIPLLANTLAWITSTTVAYITNRKFVFASKNKHILKEAGRFFAGRLISLLIENVALLLVINVLKIDPKIAKIIAGMVGVTLNYLASKFLVFGKKTEVETEDEKEQP